jgi:hypothetical protein
MNITDGNEYHSLGWEWLPLKYNKISMINKEVYSCNSVVTMSILNTVHIATQNW